MISLLVLTQISASTDKDSSNIELSGLVRNSLHSCLH